MMPCDLCKLEQLTKWHTVTRDYVVIDCGSCGSLMVVARRHTMEVGFDLAVAMLSSLAEVADGEYGRGRWRVRFGQNRIRGHLHWHAERFV